MTDNLKTVRSCRGRGLSRIVALLVACLVTFASANAADLTAEVDALIAAGEIGAATELAASASEMTRDELMQRVVLSQLQADQQADVAAVLPQMGTGRPRVEMEAALARKQLINGGANFGPLMMLIQNETEGPWFDADGEGGTMTPFMSGVKVDPHGVLFRDQREDATGELAALGRRSRAAALNNAMAQSAGLRLVSLTRLEKEVSRRLADGKPVTESMQRLGGLAQIQYLFIYPELGEIVLGGPAEGWRYNEYGMAIGVESGRPTLQLDDLVTVLRTFAPGGQGVFGCSIDPRAENLKALQTFVSDSQSRGPLSPAGVRSWATRIGKTLGMQDVTVFGVPANSRVSRVMVEADYRMKLIGIGKLDGGAEIPSYFDLLAKQPSLASGRLDALRWWLTMKYDALLHSADHESFEIRGSAVKCLSENQFLADNGQRVATGKSEPINQLFASKFTQNYDQLAQKDPIFADLQGIFDLALVAALIQREQLDARVNWDRGCFAQSGAYQPVRYPAPQQTESVVNHRVYNGKDVVLQVAGGVEADLATVVNNPELHQASPRLNGIAEKAQAPALPEGRWWWDAQ